jgi:5-methylcytosine-specific restriction endonuclease McrA
MPYKRVGRRYAVEEILALMWSWQGSHVVLDGHLVRIHNSRLHTYRKGTRCPVCGIEGAFFAIERCSGQPTFHLNLYALDEHGREVMMTSDHVVPRSVANGRPDNRQPMCWRCNHRKGNRRVSNQHLKAELERRREKRRARRRRQQGCGNGAHSPSA